MPSRPRSSRSTRPSIAWPTSTSSACRAQVSLDLVPEAVVGDHVLVHAGYAIQVVDEEYAAETLELLKTLDPDAEEPRRHRPVSARSRRRSGRRRERARRSPEPLEKESAWTPTTAAFRDPELAGKLVAAINGRPPCP